MLRRLRKISWALGIKLMLVMLFQLIIPSISFALTSGPSQPEVSGFTPIGTSEMVNVFTGDFTYNIPLLDVDGYPVNISYQSQVGMEDEASWVGLGWSLNVGTINRAVRGLPDDFNGDEVSKEVNLKPTRTIGIKGSFKPEIIGFDTDKQLPDTSNALNIGIGFYFNNYNGFGFEKSISVAINAGKKSTGPFNGSLGITSDTNEGLTIQPSLSASNRIRKNEEENGLLFPTSLGTSFNSRSGVKQLAISQSFNNEFDLNSSIPLGMQTYSPSSSMSMKNFSVSGRFTTGMELFGIHGLIGINAYYSTQELDDNFKTNPAYGYINSGEGQNNDEALMDFNREKDNPYVETIPTLALTNFTYDLYSVTGQGIGGTYRAFRSDVGRLFDAISSSTSLAAEIGAEVGLGNTAHTGFSITVNSSSTESESWNESDLNNAAAILKFNDSRPSDLYEGSYFKEANESGIVSDIDWFTSMGKEHAVRPQVTSPDFFDTGTTNRFVGANNVVYNYDTQKREHRDIRANSMTTLSNFEVSLELGLYKSDYSGLDIYTGAQDHHIAEITTLGNDGSRYIYAIPAYNTLQKEVTFAVGNQLFDASGLTPNTNTNLVSYTPGEVNSMNNQQGLDNYYSAQTTPPFAHSYLLSAIVSPEFVDNDEVDGPSLNDTGTYTKFSYTKTSTGYRWRTPVEENSASFNAGVLCDPHDDKASYIYGEKELWYLQTIETKNYMAVFYISERLDAKGVSDENGGIGTGSAQAMMKLDRIDLYTTYGYENSEAPIKSIHFEYDYSLCQNTPNSTSTSSDGGIKGKLTLKKIFFTYQESNKGALSPYEFTYSTTNPSYDRLAMDRWGNYKPRVGSAVQDISGEINNAEFPYTVQTSAQDEYAQAWLLKEISLPSGGNIQIQYESDEYAFVQNKPASQMLKIVGASNEDSVIGDNPVNSTSKLNPINNNDGVKRLYFELVSGYNSLSDYGLVPGEKVYMKLLTNISPKIDANDLNDGDFEYIPVYAKINESGISNLDPDGAMGPLSAGNYGYLELESVSTRDNDSGIMINPISLAAIQFGRMNAPNVINGQLGSDLVGDNTNFGAQVIQELVQFVVDNNLLTLFSNPNKERFNRGAGNFFVPGKSFLRATCPNKSKKGGGARVKQVVVTDNWTALSASNASANAYGQTYQYNASEGYSSGVATYEPLLGGDENPWRELITYNVNNAMTPDESRFVEGPIGESFFPSPSVGYSRVIIKNYMPSNVNVNRHGTGYIVQTFYTAKEFPIIIDKTDIVAIEQKSSPFEISSLLNIDVKDYITLSQGFVIELNDMHGKQKGQYVYAQGQLGPISSVEYNYQCEPYEGYHRLSNHISCISKNGNVDEELLGVHFDLVTDSRESTSQSQGIGGNFNNDSFVIPFFPTPLSIPTIYPVITEEKTRYRSFTATKVIHKFGILKETKAVDNTSTIKTENIAYDAITGQPLVTKTTNLYNDPIYTMTIPAHWYYDGMAPASYNIGYATSVNFTSGSATLSTGFNPFVPGDEISVSGTTNRGWVITSEGNTIQVVFQNGGLPNGTRNIKIIRSGHRNLASVPIAQLTLLTNPLDGLNSNLFEKVVQASAIEYSDEWSANCNCFAKDDVNMSSSNEYYMGARGTWRPKKNYTYLTEREQGYYNQNTNIRRDGVFTAFNPFYRLENSKWQIDKSNWTYASEITEFSPYGQEVENRDALGRYSSAHFGYLQTLPIAVAANAAYEQIGFSHFEDYALEDCARPFGFNNGTVTDSISHSGRYSIRISATNPANFTSSYYEPCESTECEFTFEQFNGTKIIYVTVIGSAYPLSINTNLITGDAVVSGINNNIIAITHNSVNVLMELEVTDAKGCTGKYVITR